MEVHETYKFQIIVSQAAILLLFFLYIKQEQIGPLIFTEKKKHLTFEVVGFNDDLELTKLFL